MIEKLEDFDLRAAAARALRDPSLSRREAILNHRELASAYWILDAAQTYATDRWENVKTRETFVAAVRETLALTIERGIELPQPAREHVRAGSGPPRPVQRHEDLQLNPPPGFHPKRWGHGQGPVRRVSP